LCSSGIVADEDIYQAYSNPTYTVIMTVSRAAAQRVNQVVVEKLFSGQALVSQVPCASVAAGPDIFPCHGMERYHGCVLQLVVAQNLIPQWCISFGVSNFRPNLILITNELCISHSNGKVPVNQLAVNQLFLLINWLEISRS